MNDFICAVKKDFTEYMRGKKNIIFSLALLAIGMMVIITTLFFPTLISALAEKAPDMISDSKSLDSMMSNLFPHNLKGSMGIWASDVGSFYSILIVLMVQGLIQKEINRGAWILPVASGYKKSTLMLSKVMVYGVGTAFPVFVLTNIYYFVASFFLDNDISFTNALVGSMVLSVAVFSIAALTIITSVFYKNSIIAALSMLIVVMVAPDVLSLFSFGKYLPTYLLTFVYSMETDIRILIAPVAELICLVVILYYLAMKRILRMEISR